MESISLADITRTFTNSVMRVLGQYGMTVATGVSAGYQTVLYNLSVDTEAFTFLKANALMLAYADYADANNITELSKDVVIPEEAVQEYEDTIFRVELEHGTGEQGYQSEVVQKNLVPELNRLKDKYFG